jgi:DNA-directed RNA polymerase subunit RPC12/RpoP
MRIEYQCPQCGAPVVLEETDRLLTCDFCKTRLFMQPRDYFRYCFSPSDPFLEEVIYVPYWRFRGVHYTCKTSGITNGIIDKTFLAIESKHFAQTLGLRPQTLKLRLVRPADNARFIPPSIPFNKSSVEIKNNVIFETVTVHETRYVRRGSQGDYAEVPITKKELREERIYHEAFMADTMSLIYAPMFVRNGCFHDAILNEPLHGGPPLPDSFPYEVFSGGWEVDFLPTLCPECGWNTLAERDSCVLFCNTCNSAWGTDKGGLKRVGFRTALSNKASQGSARQYLPFWRISIEIKGLSLDSYADLVRLGNLPRVIQPAWEEPPFYFWTPAFRMTPAVYRRMAKQFTIAPFSGAFEDKLLKFLSIP